MRRNLTISFDEKFIREMDADRGEMSRGRFLEALNGKNARARTVVAAILTAVEPPIDSVQDTIFEMIKGMDV